MPRRARSHLLYDGCFAHIISRSIEKKYVFEEDAAFCQFKELLIQARKEYGFRVYHYCLMNTHFHLAIQMESVPRFAAGMKWLKREYTNWYNQARQRRGTLWQERYKSLLIEDTHYLYACGLYMERNPVTAGMVTKSTDWPYSSSRCHELGAVDPLVQPYDDLPAHGEIVEFPEKYFERGPAIGSELFRIQMRDRQLPVP